MIVNWRLPDLGGRDGGGMGAGLAAGLRCETFHMAVRVNSLDFGPLAEHTRIRLHTRPLLLQELIPHRFSHPIPNLGRVSRHEHSKKWQ